MNIFIGSIMCRNVINDLNVKFIVLLKYVYCILKNYVVLKVLYENY